MKTLLILSISANIPLVLLIIVLIALLLPAVFIFFQIRSRNKKSFKLLEQIKTLEHERETKIVETCGAMKSKDEEIKRLSGLYLESMIEIERLEIAKKNLLNEIARLSN